jgi:DNA-directed RNA polymerase specialized sigma24 family protein
MPAPAIPTAPCSNSLRPRLKAISRRIVGSEAEAEDIVQDCFLKWHAPSRRRWRRLRPG